MLFSYLPVGTARYSVDKIHLISAEAIFHSLEFIYHPISHSYIFYRIKSIQKQFIWCLCTPHTAHCSHNAYMCPYIVYSHISQCLFFCSLPNTNKFLSMEWFGLLKQWQVIQIARPDLPVEINGWLFIVEIPLSRWLLPHQRPKWFCSETMLFAVFIKHFIVRYFHYNVYAFEFMEFTLTRSPRQLRAIEAFISIYMSLHFVTSFSNIVLFSNNNKIEMAKMNTIRLKSLVASEAAEMALYCVFIIFDTSEVWWFNYYLSSI